MTKVLVVGATGLVGSNLVRACTERGFVVRALVRPETLANTRKMDPIRASGAVIMEGSLEDFDSLFKACKSMDIVISAVSGAQLAQQSLLVRAAIKAKVKRFIPSDFGVDAKIAGEGSCALFDIKIKIHQAIKESGINYTFIHSNGFFEYWVYSLGQVGLTIGLTAPPDEVEFYGKGNVKFAMGSLWDIARITARTVDDPHTKNQEIAIIANVMTQEELIQLWEEISGKRVKRKPVSLADLEGIISTSTTPDTFMNRVLAQLKRSVWFRGDAGKASNIALDALSLYPDLHIQTVREALMQFAKAG